MRKSLIEFVVKRVLNSKRAIRARATGLKRLEDANFLGEQLAACSTSWKEARMRAIVISYGSACLSLSPSFCREFIPSRTYVLSPVAQRQDGGGTFVGTWANKFSGRTDAKGVPDNVLERLYDAGARGRGGGSAHGVTYFPYRCGASSFVITRNVGYYRLSSRPPRSISNKWFYF